MHQHGVLGVVVRVAGMRMVGQVSMKGVSASELGGVGDHLVGGGESMRGHAHAHRTTLRYVLPWHAWKTCSGDKKENVNETIFSFLFTINSINKTTSATKSSSHFTTL